MPCMPRRASYDLASVDMLLSRGSRVTRTAALEKLGMRRSTIQYRCRPQGPWQRILPGVVVAQSGTPSFHQHLVAALIYAEAGAVLTGACVLRLRGCAVFPRAPGSRSSRRTNVVAPALAELASSAPLACLRRS